MNKKVLFSTLWIFVTVNYIFCDVFTLFHSESLKQLMTGEMGGNGNKPKVFTWFFNPNGDAYGYDCFVAHLIL